MSKQLGSAERPLRIAIIGAGPSGFYAAGALLQQTQVHVQIDMFDRLPTPFGLVRYGVAPDHQKIKSVTKVYERTAADPRFRFFGNIDFGADLTHADLRRFYDQIIYAVGAQSDRKLNIPGEDLQGSLSATEFVAWYNGHPDFADLEVDLSHPNAVVVGVGNVAMDVARILAKTVDELKQTDIADHALEVLAKSKVKDIYVLSRRGPAQVKFTSPEIKEFGELADAEPVVDAAELELDPLSAKEIENDSGAQKNLEILREYAARPLTGKSRRVHFRFLVSPVELIGDDRGRVEAVRIERNTLRPNPDGSLSAQGLGEFFTLPAGLVLRSVGYKGIPLEDVPYDTRTGTIPNIEGRVLDPATGAPKPGEYVVGWAKRGPTGIIGTNKPDAVETVQRMLADLPTLTPAPEPDPAAIDALLEERRLTFITIEGWRILDQLEVANGEKLGRPRVKFIRIQDMLQALEAAVRVKVS
ncbi:MAG TPA: FAD-dependent oxidoreductase [Caldilineaceae bacterium]|nr:FAD-dependent oxidoreductase [Caldilineaceae bacterium]